MAKGSANAPRRTLLIDVSSVFYRAHHALPPMNTREGFPTAALYGTSSLLLKLLREERPAAMAFALDAPKATFRHERFEEYKGTRAPLPDALRPQFSRLTALLRAFGVPSHRVPGFEADDILATLARAIATDDRPVRIVTGDRDLFQTATSSVDVLFIGRRGEKPVVYDVARIEERFGILPARLPLYAALVGDKSDNLPGVPGIGPRSASKLAARAATAAELLEGVAGITPESLRRAVSEGAEQIRLNEELSRLRADVTLETEIFATAVSRSAISALRALFEELEFKSLLPRLDVIAALLPE